MRIEIIATKADMCTEEVFKVKFDEDSDIVTLSSTKDAHQFHRDYIPGIVEALMKAYDLTGGKDASST